MAPLTEAQVHEILDLLGVNVDPKDMDGVVSLVNEAIANYPPVKKNRVTKLSGGGVVLPQAYFGNGTAGYMPGEPPYTDISPNQYAIRGPMHASPGFGYAAMGGAKKKGGAEPTAPLPALVEILKTALFSSNKTYTVRQSHRVNKFSELLTMAMASACRLQLHMGTDTVTGPMIRFMICEKQISLLQAGQCA